MALFYPSGRPSIRQDAGLYRELDVLERLEHSLPDGYEIFHSVTWHSVHEGNDRYGEIDLVVMGPSGNLLLMEIKAGDVSVREGNLFKLYSSVEHDVGKQCRIQYAAMVNRLQEAGIRTHVVSCLVLPDYTIGDSHVVAIPRERIIDANDYDFLGTKVKEFLASAYHGSDCDAIRHFLKNEFRVSASLSVLREQIMSTTNRLADGLAVWVPRISVPSGTIRIQATAGSGKTQLAIRLLEDAVARSLAALYVCFNRTLADHIAKIAPSRAEVSNFHELGVEHFRRHHGEPDFDTPGVFGAVATTYVEDSRGFSPKYDLVIVDEGQDFEPGWVESLLPQLKGDGRLYLMEDEDQRLYEREAFDLSETVTITCRDNFRNPQKVCQVINAFALSGSSIRSCSPFLGELPGFHVYDSDTAVAKITAKAVDALLSRGFALDDVVVLTGHGRSKSVLLNADHIGRHRIRRFTGKFNRNAEPEWTDGELLVESVYRYKGQSAAAVVLSEVDFDELSVLERRKLFVGMTRAQMAVEIVMSRRTEAILSALLGG